MTDESEKIHRLVTFLGLGRFDQDRQEYVYDPTTYALGERRAETTRFVCRALAELLTPAEIVVLATEKAESVHGNALRAGAARRSRRQVRNYPDGRKPR